MGTANVLENSRREINAPGITQVPSGVSDRHIWYPDGIHQRLDFVNQPAILDDYD